MRRRFRRNVGAVVSSIVLAIPGCSDDGVIPLDPDGDGKVDPPVVGLVVSEPLSGTGVASAGHLAGWTETGTAYVSAAPGTFPGAVSVEIRNLTTGEAPAESTPVVGGGFDPVPVPATADDELQLALQNSAGGTSSLTVFVPSRRPPTVVRTSPRSGRTDVALSVRILVVLSEPIEPASLSTTSLQLLRGGAPVNGSVGLVEGSPFTAEFVPGSPLEPSTAYELVVTPDIRDLDGEALEAEARAEFTTGGVLQTALSNQIVFESHSDEDWRSGIYDSEVYVMNVDGTGLVNLTNHRAWDGEAAVSPDGTRILFVTDRDGNDEVYVMNADGSGLVNLTNHPAGDRSPVWSPDGERIAFVSYRDGSGANACFFWSGQVACSDVFVMNADGSNPVNVTDHPSALDWRPAWSPDGTRIAFQSDRHAGGTPECPDCWEIFVMDADGSNVLRLTEYPSLNAWWPTWSPDGAKIALTDGPGSIWLMNADGSNLSSLAERGLYPGWSPDGSRIVFTRSEGTNREVFVMNADGSNPVNLTNRPGFDDQIGSTQAWSP